jgi:ubiquinone/menaquinone biosynthesis C-methylase UbiE
MCHNCSKTYSIVNNIPRFVSKDNYSNSFGYQWNIFYKTQLDSYTNKNITRERVYKVTGFNSKIDLTNKNMLEAGSGAGRFTEILAETKANLFTFDFSNAIDANKLNNKNFNNVTFFQSDILKIPFENNYFDYIFCLGVIQHTKYPEETFNSLVRKLKSGGIIFIDIYSKKWHTYLWFKYILRPLTKRIPKEILFIIIKKITPLLIPYTKFLKTIFGRKGQRLSPIVEYSDLGLDKKLNEEWAILDTFDMYSPQYDQPRTISEVNQWFTKLGFKNIKVTYGPNGIIGSAIKK